MLNILELLRINGLLIIFEEWEKFCWKISFILILICMVCVELFVFYKCDKYDYMWDNEIYKYIGM